MHRVAIAAVAVLAVGAVAGLAIADPLAPGPEPDRRPLIGDEGSYAGVGIGDSARSVRRRFGDCQSSDGAAWPLSYDAFGEDVHLASGVPGPVDAPSRTLRCELAAFGVVRDRIYSVAVVDAGAQTPRGVGRGDPLAQARAAYPELRCEVNNEGSEYTPFPMCHGRLRGGPYVAFGGDPVSMVKYSRTRFLCGGECPPWP